MKGIGSIISQVPTAPAKNTNTAEEGREELEMMEAKLGVTTCDKCQQPMTKGQPVLLIVEGQITKSDDMLTFRDSCGSCVHYACHLGCWDVVKEADLVI